ncbi:carboxymuconolactone decarboxylase family protein [Microbacterium sp. LRZ72]|uniref:carboxymuconolactone decarboxylase family protein n=1 Tax=Microbacterium sp. LRZ72 TaxID=2942481 RepID=UPI0029AAA5C7|nr:carboxymuconolactone decarboxylase family protein [Microbacterium sp. LRZ72]MDX2378075.1 carboxymuconolactone decarboxylase family protein [Microbacterium sp. LRZ72]
MTDRRVHLSRAEPEAYRALDEFSRTVGRIARDNGIEDRLKELLLLHVSQLNGCAFCVRVHVERALAAGSDADEIGQLAVWRESEVFGDRERAALELAESFTFIHREGVSDEVYDRVGAVLTEREYTAVSWLSVSINAFNRVAIAGRYPVRPRSSSTT